LLELQHLFKSYRGIPAVQDVSFKVGAGEVVGLLGPNGAGKSTTVKMIIGMVRPNEGHVLFEGRNVYDDMISFRAAVGYVPEEAHLYNYLSGLEYLQLVGRLRQRVLIAAALLHDPRLLIFDEPLSGLDVVSARLFKDLLELLASQGKTILYISHVLEVVEQVCSRVVVIANGKVLADAPPAQLAQIMRLPNLESVFSQLVRQQDTRATAQQIVEVMQIAHG
jgi:ABC-2 type transport system ATP-binding protein